MTNNALQLGEAVLEALPLAIGSTKDAGHVLSIFPFLIPPAIQRIFQSASWIRSSQMPTWSQVNGWGFIDTRMHIERPLYGNYVTMALESANQNIIVAYPSIGEAPPLPRQLLRETTKFQVSFIFPGTVLEQMIVLQASVASRLWTLLLLVPVPISLVGVSTSTVASLTVVVIVILLEVALRLLVGALCLIDLIVWLVSRVQ